MLRGTAWAPALTCLLLLHSNLLQASEIVTKVFRSELLDRDYRYLVYLPDGYAKLTRRYPVLYLLHGAGGDENEWRDNAELQKTLDALIKLGQIQPLLVVMPGAPGSWWVDGAREPAQRAFLQDLMPHVQHQFRTHPEASQQLLAGISAGAYGALNLVMAHPEKFAAAALLSPAIYAPLPPPQSAALTQPPFQVYRQFSPQRWQALNYPAQLDHYKKSGVKVPLFIHSGDRDSLGTAYQASLLFERLRLHQPGAIALRIVAGDHQWALWRETLPEVLMFLNAHIHSSPDQTQLRVMSYNIRCGSCEAADDVNHWSRRKFLVAEIIKKAQVDLIGLQEAELFQMQDLAALLEDFDWVGLGRDDGQTKGEMNAVLVRRSLWAIASQKTLFLSETPERVSQGWDAMYKRTATLVHLQHRPSGKALYFLNTHFDHQGLKARRESAKLISQTLGQLGSDTPAVLTGDFNDIPGSPPYQTLSESMRDAALSSLNRPQGGDISFNGFGKELVPGNKIDYVFTDPRLEVHSHRLITDTYQGLYPSDHFPVVVELQLP